MTRRREFHIRYSGANEAGTLLRRPRTLARNAHMTAFDSCAPQADNPLTVPYQFKKNPILHMTKFPFCHMLTA